MRRPLVAACLLLAASLPALGQTSRVTSGAYNPAVSLILMGRYADLSQNPDDYGLSGFALVEDADPGEKGLSLSESELVLSANVDPLFYAELTAVLTPDDAIELEEAFFETLALGNGLTVKAGRFLSHLGYLNRHHPHAWDFVDPPLAYRAMLGNQYGDDGVQLRWVPPLNLYLEAGAELLRGENFPAGGATRDGKGARVAFLRFGGDLGTSHAWRVGISQLDAEAAGRTTGPAGNEDLFTGNSTLTMLDVVWKWAPGGNRALRHFKLQAEYFRREEHGLFTPAGGIATAYAADQRGWYIQAIYQFAPRWRVGLRYDRLKTDSLEAALAGTVLDHQGHEPTRTAAMLDFAGSEYSRLRLQVNRDESQAGKKETQWYLQYVLSLGAHGAHVF